MSMIYADGSRNTSVTEVNDDGCELSDAVAAEAEAEGVGLDREVRRDFLPTCTSVRVRSFVRGTADTVRGPCEPRPITRKRSPALHDAEEEVEEEAEEGVLDEADGS